MKWLAMMSLFGMAVFIAPPMEAGESYEGEVGEAKAVFEIEWGKDEHLEGKYHLSSREEIVFRIEGGLGSDGRLLLREYDNGKLSGVMILEKASEGGKVRWKGTHRNKNGREFAMWFGE